MRTTDGSAYKLIILVSLSILCSACSLIYDDGACPPGYRYRFRITADWNLAENADPEGMAYIFFHDTNSEPWRFDFPGKNAGYVKLPAGIYHTISFNDDTSSVSFRNQNDFEKFEIFCRKAGLFDGLGGTIDNPLGPDSINGESVVTTPDKMWGSSYSFFHLQEQILHYGDSPETCRQSTDMNLIYYQKQLTPHIQVNVRDITNLSGVKAVCASINGMAGEYSISKSIQGYERKTLPFALKKFSYSSLEGNFYSFGPARDSSSNILTIYFWLTDNRKLSYRFDVTEQIKEAPDPINIKIILKGIDLPESEPDTGSGGTDVSVDGWTVIQIDIQS